MDEKVRIGIVGVGQIGKAHIRRYAEIPEVEIIGVADINLGEAERVAHEFNIPNVYKNFRDLFARDDVLAVDVCLHNNLHNPVSIAALEAGKHVYCEKPLAGSYIDAEKMVEAAENSGQMLYMQLNTVFSTETKAAKAMIEMGMVGSIYHARSSGFRRRGRPYVDGYGSAQFVQKDVSAGGALYDMGVYHIGSMLHLLRNPAPERISGKIYQELEMDEGRRINSQYNVEELGLGFVRFDAGLTLDIIEAWAINVDKLDGSTIFGTKGGLRLDPFGYFFSNGDMNFDTTLDIAGFDWRLHSLRDNPDAYDNPEKHWVAALKGRVELLPTAKIGLNTMMISEGIYLSDALNREVSSDEVRERSISSTVGV